MNSFKFIADSIMIHLHLMGFIGFFAAVILIIAVIWFFVRRELRRKDR